MALVDHNRNHLALPSLASLPALMSLPVLMSLPAPVPLPIYGDADCRNCTGGTSMSGVASELTSLVSITLFFRVSIRNMSRE